MLAAAASERNGPSPEVSAATAAPPGGGSGPHTGCRRDVRHADRRAAWQAPPGTHSAAPPSGARNPRQTPRRAPIPTGRTWPAASPAPMRESRRRRAPADAKPRRLRCAHVRTSDGPWTSASDTCAAGSGRHADGRARGPAAAPSGPPGGCLPRCGAGSGASRSGPTPVRLADGQVGGRSAPSHRRSCRPVDVSRSPRRGRGGQADGSMQPARRRLQTDEGRLPPLERAKVRRPPAATRARVPPPCARGPHTKPPAACASPPLDPVPDSPTSGFPPPGCAALACLQAAPRRCSSALQRSAPQPARPHPASVRDVARLPHVQPSGCGPAG